MRNGTLFERQVHQHMDWACSLGTFERRLEQSWTRPARDFQIRDSSSEQIAMHGVFERDFRLWWRSGAAWKNCS